MKIEVHNMITNDLIHKYNNGTLATSYEPTGFYRRQQATQNTHEEDKVLIESYKSTIITLTITLILVTLLAGLLGTWAIGLRDSIVWHQHLEHAEQEDNAWQSS
jgi:hypothetical protein